MRNSAWNAKRTAIRVLEQVGLRPKWPKPSYKLDREPTFLFVLTPPNSGSTALANLLATSPKVALLRGNGEGQWLVPGMMSPERWDAEMFVDYASVKATWLKQYQRILSDGQDIEIVVEKSPPNLVRISKLAAQFDHTAFLAINRDPYANCSSCLYRYRDVERLTEDARREAITEFAHSWVARSALLRDAIAWSSAPLVTYEQFCAAPEKLQEALCDLGDLGFDFEQTVSVKNYAPGKVRNFNAEQIARLTEADIEAIGAVLKGHEDLLEQFGYERF